MENPLLAQAIHQRRILEIRYRNAARTIEPHTYGIGADGHEKLRCWQIGGASDSGERSGWKLLNVSDIRATTMSERQLGCYVHAPSRVKISESVVRFDLPLS